LAIKIGGKVHLRSRNDNDFNARYPGIVKALATMPDNTVIDGEVVALDGEGRPSFNMLENYGSAGAPLHFFIFDVLVLKGRDVMGEPLVKRRELIEEHVLPTLADPIRYSPILDGNLKDLVRSVKAQGLAFTAKVYTCGTTGGLPVVLSTPPGDNAKPPGSDPDESDHV
jgi:bifunctional non-homologous end joining protein LigD